MLNLNSVSYRRKSLTQKRTLLKSELLLKLLVNCYIDLGGSSYGEPPIRCSISELKDNILCPKCVKVRNFSGKWRAVATSNSCVILFFSIIWRYQKYLLPSKNANCKACFQNFGKTFPTKIENRSSLFGVQLQFPQSNRVAHIQANVLPNGTWC